MGADLIIEGFRPVDEEWKKMKAVYDACKAAGVEVPEEVNEFFNWEKPSDFGMFVDVSDAIVTESNNVMLVDLTKLPKNLKTLRVYLNY